MDCICSQVYKVCLLESKPESKLPLLQFAEDFGKLNILLSSGGLLRIKRLGAYEAKVISHKYLSAVAQLYLV